MHVADQKRKEGRPTVKRVFGTVEAVFDILYLGSALVIGMGLLLSATGNVARGLAGMMAMVLAGGDAFHLIPRTLVIITRKEECLRQALGRGKQITSMTMTIFYVLLWHLGLLLFSPDHALIWSLIVYVLAIVRLVLCLLPHNRWTDRYPPESWGIGRNIPFFLLGVLVAGWYLVNRTDDPRFASMGVAVALSFAFYLPVVLGANKNPKIGMLMLPKTMCYLWMLILCLSL